jgi:hypothetical protein
MTLLFVTTDGRHITHVDVAQDAADTTYSELPINQTARDLMTRVEYYAEGWPVTERLWRAACEALANRLVEAWSDVEAEEDAYHGTRCPCCEELTEQLARIRSWEMPAQSVAAVAAE